MKTLDLKTSYKTLYGQHKGKLSIVDVPSLSFLAIDGKGDPNTSAEYRNAVEALYAVAYGLKFAVKRRTADPVDYPVMPLEGLWWVPDMKEFSMQRKDKWQWRMMIMQPPLVTMAMVEEMKVLAGKKKDLPSAAKVRLAEYHEGVSAQILHLGPYVDEAPTVQALHEFIEVEGYLKDGLHHEVYLGDPRKTEPSRLKTIIRQPMRKR
jgi:hypothetical protein